MILPIDAAVRSLTRSAEDEGADLRLISRLGALQQLLEDDLAWVEAELLASASRGERPGRDVAPRDVVIIGDTPYDVHCAKAHGARVLAVATGHFDVDALRATGADRVEHDLSDTAGIVRWISGS